MSSDNLTPDNLKPDNPTPDNPTPDNSTPSNLVPDYQKLSELYGTFLGALGGVSITVLSIVMAFKIEGITKDLQPFLIATLSAAAFSCFTGGHLMTETAAFICKSPLTRTGARLCAIATINIYISVVLIIFSLVLMTMTIGDQANAILKWFTISLFACIILGALRWMILTIKDRLGQPEDTLGWWSIFIVSISSLVCIYVLIIIPPPTTIWAALFITLICTFLSLIYFTATYKRGDQLYHVDRLFFAWSISFPCFSIVFSCLMLTFGKETLSLCGG